MKSHKKPSMTEDRARAIALDALAWIAADEERLRRFLDVTGINQHEIRALVADPGFAVALLDHVRERDDDVVACAAAGAVTPGEITEARLILGGQNQEF